MKMRDPLLGVLCCFARIGKQLERRDLRKIQNRRDGNGASGNVNCRMVVDAEVAHRVGREEPRRDEQGQQERDTECDFHSTGTTEEDRDLDGN